MNIRKAHFCRSPFEHFEIASNGDVHLCCPGWVRSAVGNLGEQSLEEIWNGEKAQALRASVLDGSYSQCHAHMCPHLQTLDQGARLPEYSPIENFDAPKTEYSRRISQGIFPKGPSLINGAFDLTCNLSCPSCRREPIVYRPGTIEWQRAEKMANSIISAFPRVNRLKLAGNGDPFASRLYWKMLTAIDKSQHPKMKVVIHTNGLLFTPDRWKELSKAHGLIDTIEVSIDAALPESYALNRRGGSFETLLERIAFIGKLRQENHFRRWIVSFVVQANNFREMPAFVELGRSVHADTIVFNRMNDWGSFPSANLATRSIHRVEHPQHAEFVDVLSQPVFDEPGIFIGNLSEFRRPNSSSDSSSGQSSGPSSGPSSPAV